MVTGKRNQRHAVELGLKKRTQWKLNDSQINEIKNSYVWGSQEYGIRPLSKKYGVSMTAIWRAIYGYERTRKYMGRELREHNGRKRDMRVAFLKGEGK